MRPLEILNGVAPVAREVERSSGFQFQRIGDLLAAPEELIRWLVDGMLPSGGVSVLVGKPKSGKSTLARVLSLKVARGDEFLGRATRKGGVAYLALEEKRSEVVRHFRDLGATNSDEILVHAGTAPDCAVEELSLAIRKNPPALIVVDTLFRLARVRSGGGDDYATMTAAFDPILSLARTSGAHVLALHHAPKADRTAVDAPLGSTAISGSVDTIVFLKKGDRFRTVTTEQRVGENLPETVLEFDAENRSISLGQAKEEAEDRRIASEIEEVLRGRESPMLEDELLGEVEGKTGAKRRVLRELLGSSVERFGAGKRGDPFLYRGVSRPLVPPVSGNEKNENQRRPENPHGYSSDSRSQEISQGEDCGNELFDPATGVAGPPEEELL